MPKQTRTLLEEAHHLCEHSPNRTSPAIYESVPEIRGLLPADTLKSFH